jgi:hypothetical protein
MPAVTHLLMLLDRHPELLRELEAIASPSPATGASDPAQRKARVTAYGAAGWSRGSSAKSS